MVFLSVVILLVILMTNVINNMVAAMIFITILYSLEPTHDCNENKGNASQP